ncbi:MAG: SulP family inorganic anion transporter [Actinomycetota bacterium]|nr:SulP family inorganic anion transporter [Actinomycetota bacterium]
MPSVLSSLRSYRPKTLRLDLVAGVSVWAVLVPESLAYATIAGVPPVVGLYAAIPALILYAIFGSSRILVVATMSATAALSASIVADFAAPSGQDFIAITAALAIVTGILGIAAGLARLGFLANFISEPVLKGFIVGLALTIIAGQLPELFGVTKESGNFFQEIAGLIGNLPSTNSATLAVGLVSLTVVLGFRRWLPLLPGSLAAVVLGILATTLLDLPAKGVEVVGPISAGLPSVGLPDGLGFEDYLALGLAAAGVLLLGFVEGLGPAKTYAARDGYDVDANRELIGLGAANLGAGLTSGMVVNGSLSKSAVNANSGARTQLSGLTVAALTVITLLFLTGLFESLPEATLAAVVIAAVIELVDFPALARFYRVWTGALGQIYGWAARADFIAATAALVGVLVFDTLPGLFIGITISVLLLVFRSSRPEVAALGRSIEPGGVQSMWVDTTRHPEILVRDDISVLRVESALFFANADNVRSAIRQHITEKTIGVVLDLATTPAIDVTATEMLAQLAQELRGRGVRLVVAHGIGQVRDFLQRAGSDTDVLQALYATVDEAVASFDESREN